MRIIEPLEAENIYHIFNRGINGDDIFKEIRNYYYFLDKYKEYCSDILETYAYSLLKNHFHLIAREKDDVIVTRRDGKGEIKLNASKQLSHFFNCYAQSYNNAYGRHGKLFEEPFKRKLVNSDSYLTSLITYVHCNPQQHQFVKDFRDWEFTSWHAIMGDTQTFIARKKVLEWFGSKKHFIDAHIGNVEQRNIEHLFIE